jgi:DNA-binding transcriptional LysR family regulator
LSPRSWPLTLKSISTWQQPHGVVTPDRRARGTRQSELIHALRRAAPLLSMICGQTIREIEFLANPTSGEVRVGCPETVAALMPPIIETAVRQYPGIVLHVFDVAARPWICRSFATGRSISP